VTPLLVFLLQAATPDPAVARFDACIALIESDVARAVTEADTWRQGGGGVPAAQCLGLAYVKQDRFAPAAAAFAQAAEEARIRGDGRAAQLWVLAGNAALAGGDAARARDELGKALALPVLGDPQRGEAYLDRARALVALGNLAAARTDIDEATRLIPTDPLGWLLSANLARRMNDASRARAAITEALRLSPDDPSVQYEAGNVAAIGGVTDTARAAWRKAVENGAATPGGQAAAAALEADAETRGAAPARPGG